MLDLRQEVVEGLGRGDLEAGEVERDGVLFQVFLGLHRVDLGGVGEDRSPCIS